MGERNDGPRPHPPEDPATPTRVAALLATGDYAAAARAAAAGGDLRRAIQLYERIWRFADAVPLAEELGDRPLAIRLALETRDRTGATRIAADIPAGADAELAAAADAFAARGHHLEAASLAERAGAVERAAELYRRGGALLPAARALERAGRWNDAGRLFEEVAAAPDTEPATAAEAQLALGRLLGRLGRPREAARALQSAARHPQTAEAAERRLCVELGALGLAHAAEEIARRVHARDPALPESAVAIAELELQAAAGRAPAPEPLRRFTGLKLLGVGALGRVYAAQDLLLGATVALKILAVGAGASGPERQSFLRFVREADASSRLRHPHIVRLLDLDERAGMLVFEHMPGGTLAAVLARDSRLGLAAGRRLALELLSALSAAHQMGIVHRDVKPANIFFDAAGNAKLSDFGAAHLTDFGSTQTAGFIGTLAYLSPEQISGAPIDFAADLYGLGITLFQALTGRLPFPGPDIVAQHLAEAPPRPSALEPVLSALHDEVLLRALAKAPADCFASAEAMAEAIHAWPEHGRPRAAATPTPVGAPPETPTPAPATREPLGPTTHGTLYLTFDPRVGRRVLVEELEAPLDASGQERLRQLARAGGPHVQRVLAIDADARSIVYEALDAAAAADAPLGAEERGALEAAWQALAPLGVPGPLVVRTAGGPVLLVVAPIIP